LPQFVGTINILFLYLIIYIFIYSAIQQPNKYYKYARKKRSSENKKLVFLSKKVLEEVSTKRETTGTNVSFSGFKSLFDR
jgi:hypothetical protein